MPTLPDVEDVWEPMDDRNRELHTTIDLERRPSPSRLAEEKYLGQPASLA